MFQTVITLLRTLYLIRHAVSLIRQAVGPHRHNYADRHNPITYVR